VLSSQDSSQVTECDCPWARRLCFVVVLVSRRAVGLLFDGEAEVGAKLSSQVLESRIWRSTRTQE
jgi:hypothetical protein